MVLLSVYLRSVCRGGTTSDFLPGGEMRVEKAIEGSTLKLSREFKSGGQDENRKKEERKNLSETNNTTKENSIKFFWHLNQLQN